MRRKPQHKALWGRSWDVLGRVWTLSGHSWGAFGRSWGALGAILGAFGSLLGQSWGILGALGRPWALLGRSWGALGAFLGRSLGYFGGLGARLGIDFASISGRVGCDLGLVVSLVSSFCFVVVVLRIKKSCGKLGAAGEIWGKR